MLLSNIKELRSDFTENNIKVFHQHFRLSALLSILCLEDQCTASFISLEYSVSIILKQMLETKLIGI